MAVNGAVGRQEDVDDPLRRLEVDLSGAEGEDVRVVVLARVAGERFVVAGGGEDPGNLVRGHRRADSGAVDDHGEAAGAGGNELGGRLRDLRVVDRFLAVRAEVADGVTGVAKVFLELFLELEAAVIGAESDLKGVLLVGRGHCNYLDPLNLRGALVRAARERKSNTPGRVESELRLESDTGA